MTFINLRKRAPKPEPDATEDTIDEPDTPPDPDEVPGFPRALLDGVKGWWTWCTHRVGLAWTGGAHALALWSIAYYGGWAALGISLALLTAVALFVPRASIDRLATHLETRLDTAPPTPDDDPEPDDEPAPPDPLITLLWHLIDTAPGVHLKTLTEHLAEGAAEVGQEPPSKAAVEARLDALGIGLRPSVRNTHGKVNRGVHRADLLAADRASSPADSSPLPGPP